MTNDPIVGERKTAGEALALAESWQAAGRDVQVVAARNMALLIAVTRNPETGRHELRAEAPAMSRRDAAATLRYVARQFDEQADAAGEPPASVKLPG